MAGGPGRRWTLTIFEESAYELLCGEDVLWPSALRYLVGQLELCPNSGRTHYQGYAEFHRPVRLSWLKNWLGSRDIHAEHARATAEANRLYCTKENGRVLGPWSYGEPGRGGGTRSDLEECRALLREGADDVRVAGEYFGQWCRYNRSFDRYRRLLAAQEDAEGRGQPQVEVYWGPTGTGKSHKAQAQAGPLAYWLPPPNQRGGALWWDGLCGQDVLVIDDFDGEWITVNIFLRLCDRYPLLLPTKGGFTSARFSRIYITSNTAPRDWFHRISGTDARRDAVLRRISSIEHLTVPYTP